MLHYKDIMVAKASVLYTALQAKDKKLAEKIYKETSARYAAMYSKEDREYFSNWGKS